MDARRIRRRAPHQPWSPNWRYRLCYVVIAAAFLHLAWVTLRLQTDERDSLVEWSSKIQQRVHKIGAKRSSIFDRNGQPLAISSKVYDIGIDPRLFNEKDEAIARLARVLGSSSSAIKDKLAHHRGLSGRGRAFFYLSRKVPPAQKRAVRKLGLSGIVIEDSYKRFYPHSESFATIIGLTNTEDVGIGGLELAYNESLMGSPGKKLYIRDNRGGLIESLGIIKRPRPGRDLRLSIDRRLQHLAYTELGKTVDSHQALAGSLVMIDARSGEILAMANVPSFNPNNRTTLSQQRMRNRGAVDVFEPGSTIKPFTIAGAIDSGVFTSDSSIDTGSGKLDIGEYQIKDISANGVITVRETLMHSSNVGASKIALQIGADKVRRNLARFGFGRPTHSGYPGENPGFLQRPYDWPDAVVASHSYGYGLSTTLLQLARAYAILANRGRDIGLSFQLDEPGPASERVLAAEVADEVLGILGDIVREGTGSSAQINGYSVGGKTGTSRKLEKSGGYSQQRYNSFFVGISPLSQPRIVCAIIIDEPQGDYYGGQVAAPLFARVVSAALRLLGEPADRIKSHGA